MQVELRPRSLGEQISVAGKLTAAHFPKLFLLMAGVQIPAAVLQYWASNLDQQSNPTLFFEATLLMLAFVIIAGPLATGACIAMVAGSFTGKPITLGQSVSRGLSRVWGVLGVSMAVGIVCGLGAMLLIVPGLIFMTWFFVAVCVLMVEHRGVGDSMSRSRELVRGHGWSVFAFLVLVYVVVGVGSMATMFLVAADGTIGIGAATLSWLVNSAFSVLSAVAPVVVYFDLRTKREAFDVETLAELVDDIGRRGGRQRRAAG